MLLTLALASQSFVQARAPLQEEPSRGWLGVSLEIEDGRERPLTASEVADGSPAAESGLLEGDRLIALEGRALESYDGLVELLREHGPGREIALTVRRALEVELDDRGWGQQGGPRLGVHLGQLDGGDDGDGARWVVRQAEDGWPAARAGVHAGDRIAELAGREPADFDELQSLLAEVEPAHALELVIERDLKVRLGRSPGETAALAPHARFELVPGDGERALRLWPHAESRERTSELESRLREEIAGLSQELRALREELRTLRLELAALRER